MMARKRKAVRPKPPSADAIYVATELRDSRIVLVNEWALLRSSIDSLSHRLAYATEYASDRLAEIAQHTQYLHSCATSLTPIEGRLADIRGRLGPHPGALARLWFRIRVWWINRRMATADKPRQDMVKSALQEWSAKAGTAEDPRWGGRWQ